MELSQIKEQCTYRTLSGASDLYVQAIEWRRVIYVHVGQIARQEASLARFASMVRQQIPNQ